ncbi:glycosyltransferase [Tieghemostelium lacteum]|uniref:Dolichyl-phosphate beta-glucosyltransferase n=1 Tax=Tieghemostelium lacteum TaxID=361077 RepID=A0A151ZFX6_TIELA|nr:glycosyltransferase [Tieghemostelium lacteum]|eukprot:KYQ92882.1 glycosyltransferase [Tieghemostelium lacteum]
MYFYIITFIIIFIIIYNILFKKDKNFENVWVGHERQYIDPKDGSTKEFTEIKKGDKGTIEVSIVIPAYNEEKRLPIMLDDTLKILNEKTKKNPNFTFELVIVDDGSRDKTSSLVLQYAEREGVDKVRLLKLLKNRGKGGAVKRGMLVSRGKYCLMADADGATDFKDFDRVYDSMKKIESKQYGVVCGSRSHLVDSDVVAKRSFFRNLLMYGFHLVVQILCVRGIKDTQCGFKLFTRESARHLFTSLHVERWAFDVELLYLAQTLHMPIAEVAVNWTEIDGSKLDPIASSIQMAKDILRIRLNYLFRFWTISS